jgi:hypothetical protein
MNVQPLQPWARAWDRRMRERKEVEPPTELEQTLADYADFLSCAPMRMVEGFEVEIGEFGGCRTVARLSCGHTQGAWREAGIRCLGCYHNIVAAREASWLASPRSP